MRKTLSLVCALLLVSGSAPATAEKPKVVASFPGTAAYSIAIADLDAALGCNGGRANLDGAEPNEPVLLVHGTGSTRKQNFGWNYWKVLHEQGFEVCWVALPTSGLNDAQISSEYVAYAIEAMNDASGERIDVLGHSQGGLHPRWAIKWFPSGAFVDDYVGLASPNHGTVVTDAATLLGSCFESCWQMRTTAALIATLNRDDETPGDISYTNVYTTFDQLVQPVGTSALDGGANIVLQDVCPGRPVEHLGIVGDAVAYRIAVDAFSNPGPADVARSGASCSEVAMPGASGDPDAFNDANDWEGTRVTREEPALMPYAR